MVMVEDINKAFAAKGVYITIPIDPKAIVKEMEVLEMVKSPGFVKVLLRLKYLDENGKEVSGVFPCEGSRKIEPKPARKLAEPLLQSLLPTRDRMTFDTEEEALNYLRQAITHLLGDKGYTLGEKGEADLSFQRGGKNFLINLSLRLNDEGFERAKALVELRRKRRNIGEDYALVVPAFQESLGVPLRLQERWIALHQDHLSTQRIGVYGADNQDPNRIYPFTIYPTSIELKRYFMITSQQWSMVRSRYVLERAKRRKEEGT